MTDELRDVVIIGGGPGGYVAAIRAAQLGLSVTLVEKERLGGICLNWGCIPTKALLRNAEVIQLLGEGKTFGFELEGFKADYGLAVKRSRKVSERLVRGVGALMRGNEVEVVEGTGRIAEPGIVHVAPVDGGEMCLDTKAIIVATGARARSIPGVEVDGKRVITSRHALEMQELPSSVVIVGAGPIGMEFAHVWATYGAQVTIVEMLPRLLPLEDEEVSREIERAYKRRKIGFLTSSRVQGVEPTGSGARVTVQKKDGKTEPLEADKVLVAIGVQPNSEDLGLEDAGVRAERGWISVDERMRTSAEG
ncbi:MAG: FAD-dependent oxidoreductase, partial [Anaerolineae bacterium]